MSLSLKMKFYKPAIILTIMIICFALSAVSGVCEGGAESKNNYPKEPPIHKGYPLDFSEMGYVDEIGSRYIIIGDTKYHFLKDARFNIPRSLFVNYSSIKKKDYVGIILQGDGMVESIWKINK